MSSRAYNADRDVVLGNSNPLFAGVKKSPYSGDLPVNDYRLSPLHAYLTNFPPILIQAGSHETLLDDSLEFMQKAVAYDVDVTLTVYKNMPHDFGLCIPKIQNSVEMLREVGDFVNRHMKK